MENITRLLKALGPTRIIMIALVALFMIGFFSAIVTRMNAPHMTLLYGGLTAQEAGEMAQRLGQMNIAYEVKGESNVYVPDDKVGELRLQLAGEGYVGGGTTGYEIFDKSSGFGTTSLVQNINARRALEGELSRTIASLPLVRAARVHVVVPKRRLFSKEKINPTASVTLNLGSRILGDDQIQSIVHLVAAAVPNLDPKDVTLVDTKGNLLASGNGKGIGGGNLDNGNKLRRRIEAQYKQQLEELIERVVGVGNVSAQVTANIDFNHVEETSELFDPDQAVVRSQQTTEESNNSQRTNGTPPAGLAANIPGQTEGGTSVGSTETGNRLSETVNYEISKTIRKKVKTGGAVTRLSVAVLVAGTQEEKDGKSVYVPRSEQELNKLSTLVKTAIGFNEDRGDTVEVIDMPFTEVVEEELPPPPFLSKGDIFKLAEYGLFLLGLVFMIFFVVKPIITAARQEMLREQEEAQTRAQTTQTKQVTTSTGEVVEVEVPVESDETMIDIEKVEGRVKESSIKKVQEIVDQYPDESVAVIRSWMSAE